MHILMSLIFSGHARECIWLQTVLSFSLPVGVFIDVNFILTFVTIGSNSLLMSTNYTFATIYKGIHTKVTSVIDEPVHVAVGLQLLEMSSITTPNQTISNVCTRYIFQRALFLGKTLVILSILDIK